MSPLTPPSIGDLLQDCSSPQGFVASQVHAADYRRVWTRDGVFCGLAGIAADESGLIDTLVVHLEQLARRQASTGQIPSNFGADGTSYGGKVGRVDANLWFLLGVGLVACHRPGAVDGLREATEHCLQLCEALELNGRGLLYTPLAGNWADEYPLHGYLLSEQALRLWALEALAAAGWTQRPTALRACIARHYWPRDPHRTNDPRVLSRAVDPERRYFLAGFHPGGHWTELDALGNALAVCLEVGTGEDRIHALHHAAQVSRHGLVPAFWPPITEGPRSRQLELLAAFELRNHPGSYHNGGLWPMVTALWVLAARMLDAELIAERWARGIEAANANPDHPYPEYLSQSGTPGGARLQAWSAAAELLARQADLGRLFPWREP